MNPLVRGSQENDHIISKEKYEKSNQMGQEGNSSLCSTTTTNIEAKFQNSGKVFNESQSEDQINNSYRDSKNIQTKTTSDRIKYNFNISEFGDSWILGNETTIKANAFKDGVPACPENLVVPRTLKDENDEVMKVSVIGQYAFYGCSCIGCGIKGNTRRLTLTRYVKVIKYCGLGGMDDLESFRIEEGSVLETIEQHGLHFIGYNTGKNDPTKRRILTLPSTLSSVDFHGIWYCNLFNTIVYCGSHPLVLPCTLEWGFDEKNKTVVNVTNKYPSNTNLFGRTPDRRSEVEEAAEAQCNYYFEQLEKPCSFPDFATSTSHMLTLFSPLLPSHSVISLSFTRFLHSIYFPIK